MEKATSKMKGFYRQRKSQKTGTGISKKANASKPPNEKSNSDTTQQTALIFHGSPDLHDDRDKNEQLLRLFDMNMAYGPCLGMTRIARWERAQHLGLNPPKEIEVLLKDVKVNPECLWDGRV